MLGLEDAFRSAVRRFANPLDLRSLRDAPSDQTIRKALKATLPDDQELHRRINSALADRWPKSFYRRGQRLAIDLSEIPYHGEPQRDKKEIRRGKPKQGTSHFHAYRNDLPADERSPHPHVQPRSALAIFVRGDRLNSSQRLGLVSSELASPSPRRCDHPRRTAPPRFDAAVVARPIQPEYGLNNSKPIPRSPINRTNKNL